MTRTITDPSRYVDADQLECPGCGDPVVPADDQGRWSHRDGSLLCWYLDGQIAEPIEADRPRKRVH